MPVAVGGGGFTAAAAAADVMPGQYLLILFAIPAGRTSTRAATGSTTRLLVPADPSAFTSTPTGAAAAAGQRQHCRLAQHAQQPRRRWYQMHAMHACMVPWRLVPLVFCTTSLGAQRIADRVLPPSPAGRATASASTTGSTMPWAGELPAIAPIATKDQALMLRSQQYAAHPVKRCRAASCMARAPWLATLHTAVRPHLQLTKLPHHLLPGWTICGTTWR